MNDGKTPGLGAEGPYRSAMQSSSFGPAAWLLDGAARRDLGTYYAFCRAVDDCADEFAPKEARRHLAAWREELAALAQGNPGSELGRDLADLLRRRGIPLARLGELLDGAEADAAGKARLRTRADLRRYCYQVAGSVGRACLPIFGVEEVRGEGFARALGEAFQIINILRDVREDARRGRRYVALEDLTRFGLTEGEFLAGEGGARAQRLFYEYGRLARAALREADRAAAGLPAKGLRAPRMMRLVYGGILETMEKDGYRVFEKRYSLGRRKKFAALARGLLWG
jgi:phytoene synthase